MSKRALASGREGFTLIELLVVIAIILILAAIAVPVLARAAAHARDVKCVSNVRQVSQGLIQYTGNYDGSFPCCYNTLTAGWSEWTLMTWREKIMPYVAGNVGDLKPHEYKIPAGPSIFKCSGRSMWPTGGAAASQQVQSIYGVNAYIALWTGNVEKQGIQAKYQHIDSVENTSATVLVTENDDGDFATTPDYDSAFPYSNRTTGIFKAQHRNDRAAFGFCDGRSTTMDKGMSHERKLHFWKLDKRKGEPQ
ncbi:prepilin-type N-terminal cleavage/methylation domain-containing protein [Planctomycetota bacterium]